MLSMSSTTIIIKAFNDLELRNQRFTGIVFGTLVVEDLIAILMMVLLSTMAVSQDFVGEDLLISVLKVVFFFNPVVSHRYLRYSGLSQKSKEVDE